MREDTVPKKHLSVRRVVLCAAVALIFFSRLPGLMHNSSLHSDENVFYNSASNLAACLMGDAGSYEPTKFYPEGSFTLHMPFQLLRMFLGSEARQLWGRIGGLVYFILGTVMGLHVLRRYLSDDPVSTLVYLATMLFGVMHIEQSRYATGDTATFFLLMVLLSFSARGMEEKSLHWFFLASMAGGMLTAVKYPLVFFLLIPFLGYRKAFTPAGKSFWVKNTALAAGCFLAGFLLLSPKTLTSPAFLFWTAAHETHNYMAGSNLTEVGGPLNHLISVTAYTLLYAGFPILGSAAVLGLGKGIPAAKAANGCEYLFRFLIPLITAGFFVYNLFVTAVFLRTYYPFFVILDLYCAALCGRWWKDGRKKRNLVTVLSLLLVLRGGAYLYILGTDNGVDTMKTVLSQIPEDSYTAITELKPGHMAFDQKDLPQKDFEAVDLEDSRFDTAEGMELREGELLISTYLEKCIGTPYYLPISHPRVNGYITRWAEFREVNDKYLVGQLYPDSWYLLFGFWVKGSTGTVFEFPCNLFFLRPVSG